MKTADFGAGAKTELGQTRLFGGIELDAGDRGAGAGLKIRETAERFCGSDGKEVRDTERE